MSDPTATKTPEPENWMLQVSLKTARGALINIRGKDASDLEINLGEMNALAETILDLEHAFQPASAVPAAAAPLAPTPVAQSAPAPANAPMCLHGQPAKYVKGGVSRQGRPYAAFWACAQPRESQCDFRQTA